MSYTKKILNVQQNPMECLVFEPPGSGPFPAFVVAQHVPNAHDGLEKDPFTIDIGKKLAAAGYASIIPFIFHWWPPETDSAQKRAEWRDDRTVADLEAAYNFLLTLEKVNKNRIGIIGHCWGGRVAWLGACHNPNYKISAVLYGGRIKIGMGPNCPPPIDLTANMNCSVIGIFGSDDKNPSPEDVKDLETALKNSDIKYEFHSYDGAGHGFQDFVNEDRFRPEATRNSWKKLISFFEKNFT